MFIEEEPVALIPTHSLPTEMPANQTFDKLPIILSESGVPFPYPSRSGKVTKIEKIWGMNWMVSHYD